MFRRLFGWFNCEKEKTIAIRTVQELINISTEYSRKYGRMVYMWDEKVIVAFVQDVKNIASNMRKL